MKTNPNENRMITIAEILATGKFCVRDVVANEKERNQWNYWSKRNPEKIAAIRARMAVRQDPQYETRMDTISDILRPKKYQEIPQEVAQEPHQEEPAQEVTQVFPQESAQAVTQEKTVGEKLFEDMTVEDLRAWKKILMSACRRALEGGKDKPDPTILKVLLRYTYPEKFAEKTSKNNSYLDKFMWINSTVTAQPTAPQPAEPEPQKPTLTALPPAASE